MRWLILALGLLLLFPWPVLADCTGRDLMAALARDDPPAHARILDRADAVENGQARLWRVTHGTGPPSWLFGTLHSTAAVRGMPVEAVRALDRARLLLVELTPAEQARMQARMARDPTFLRNTDGASLSERLPPQALAMARDSLALRGLSLDAVDILKPWLLIGHLAAPACELALREAGRPVLDEVLIARAEARGLPVAGLETFEDSIAPFEAMTEAEITGLLVDGFAGIAREEDTAATLDALYAQGAIAAIMEFSVWQSDAAGSLADSRAGADAIERTLLSARNRAWIGRIAGEAARGGVFAAFGALHLMGPEGVVALLRERGFSVEPVTE